MRDDDWAAPGAVALEEARRSIDRQHEDFGTLRDRSMTVLGAGGVVAGLIVGFRPEDARLTGWSWLALGAFVATSAIAVVIALPKRLTFVESSATILQYADEHNPTQDALARRLAQAIEAQYDGNEGVLIGLTYAYAVAIATFVLEIAFLLIDLKG